MAAGISASRREELVAAFGAGAVNEKLAAYEAALAAARAKAVADAAARLAAEADDGAEGGVGAGM